jgi:hypothetical protein
MSKQRVTILTFAGAVALGLLMLGLLSTSGLAQEPPPQAERAPRISASVAAAMPLSTSFTYQGQLKKNDAAVSGDCAMAFRLYDAAEDGVQVGSALSPTVPVSNSLFTVQLDFGASAFTGDARWLGIRVQCPGDAAYTDLGCQPLTAAPHALYALAAPWSGLRGVPPGFADGVDDVSVVVSGTQVYAGEGLVQLASGDTVTLSLGAMYRLPQVCANGQIAEWNGALWVCGDDDVGSGGSASWSLTGNAGTDPAVNFLGTTDAASLTLAVDGAPALRLSPAVTSPNVIGGYGGNVAGPGVAGASIGGGGLSGAANGVYGNYGVVGGGVDNVAYGELSTVAGGERNSAGYEAMVGGGDYNHAQGDYSVIAGGDANHAAGNHTFVGGGLSNYTGGPMAVIGGGESISVTGNHAFVGGGMYITVTGDFAAVGGGAFNTANGYATVIGGGGGYWHGTPVANTASGDWATVGGGSNNAAGGNWATVGGGGHNTTSGEDATVGGGWYNTASGMDATIGGGQGNIAIGVQATIGGGESNVVTATHGTIAGGYNITITGDYAAVGGGNNNTASGLVAVIGGGSGNIANGAEASVGGGIVNTASGTAAVIGGGDFNEASGSNATIGGGRANIASGFRATVAGGRMNIASGIYAVIGGGGINISSGGYATVGGGESNLVTAMHGTIAGGYNITVTGVSAVVGGGDNNIASGGRATVGGGYSNEAAATSATVGGGHNNIASNNAATVAGGADNTASGGYAAVGGGGGNTASGANATVSGGGDNTASGSYAIIGGGNSNEVTATHATIGGGYDNTVSGGWAIVGGGADNTANGVVATVGGGGANIASGGYTTVGGGYDNTASGNWATVPGGAGNVAQGYFSLAAGRRARALHQGTFVWADSTDADFDSTGNDQFRVRANGGMRMYTGANSAYFESSGGNHVNSTLVLYNIGGGSAAYMVGNTGSPLAEFDQAGAGAVLDLQNSGDVDGNGGGNFITGYSRDDSFDLQFRITSSGQGRSDVGWVTPAEDFAEMLPAVAGLESGDVLAIGPDGTLVRSTSPYQTSVAGVYSTQPGFIGGQPVEGPVAGTIPLAVVGIVPVKVTAENGVILPGDLLVASSRPGHAMKAGPNPPQGTVIGKALEKLDASQDTGVIKMLATLQ